MSVDTPTMQDPEIAIDDFKASSTQHINLHDTVNNYNIKKIDEDLSSIENQSFGDILSNQEGTKKEAMEIDVNDDIIISGLSDEVLRLNPDFAALYDLGYGRVLRRREEKVIKEEPKIIEKPIERKKPKSHRKKGQKVHETKLIECKCCSKTFQSKSGFRKHARKHNVNNMQDLARVYDDPQSIKSNFNCILCKKNFETNTALLSHKKEKHSNIDPFMCKNCKVAFSDHYDYLIHQITHINYGKSPFPCPECPKMLTTKSSYRMHIGLHFESKFPCDVCMKSYGCERHLILHKRKAHEGVKNSKICPECHKVFDGTSLLNYHILSHTGVRPYQCLYCGKGFRSMSARKNHTRTHKDETPYECDTCHRKFRSTGGLQRHQENHNKDKLICEICDKKYTHAYSLKQHQRRHTNTGLYKCPECDHSSVTRGNLRTHMIHMHTTEKLHRCDICNLGFKTKWELKQHSNRRVHKNNTFGFMKKKGELNNK